MFGCGWVFNFAEGELMARLSELTGLPGVLVDDYLSSSRIPTPVGGGRVCILGDAACGSSVRALPELWAVAS